MTVTELIAELQQIPDPDTTIVAVTESEIDYPCNFVALDEIIHRGW